MERREFIRIGALGSAVALTGCEQNECAAERSGAPLPTREFELAEATIETLQNAMETRESTASEIAESYLAWIADVDRGGPEIRAVIELNPDVLSIARSMDAEREQGRSRGPLHGIPVMLKDNIDTADGMHTTAGSLALAGHIARRDSFVALKLREAGAVILGKTNLSEWANFRSTRSTSGWSGRGGLTRNPYALDRNPCGSSSGSAAAVSANLCTVAIGTETDGSILCPSSACGVVGIKPTVGLVSRSGIIPISHTQDTAGPMARTVRDAAVLLSALTATDRRDPASVAGQGRGQADYTRFLDPGGLRGARLGVARNYFGYHGWVDRLIDEAIAAIRDAGAEVVDEVSVDPPRSFGGDEMRVLLYEFKHGLNLYLAGTAPGLPARTLESVIRFNEEHAEKEMPYFGQDRLEQAQQMGPLTEEPYLRALERGRRLAGAEGIDAVLKEHSLDALIAPTAGPPWPTDLVNGDHFIGGSSSAAAVAGYPTITVPAGFVHGLPVGISFIGTAWSEPSLLRFAHAFELATRLRVSPAFRPTVAAG
jgi:amidase